MDPHTPQTTINQQITDDEFKLFQKLIFEQAGISMSPAKKMMVAGRLQRRLAYYGLRQYGDYYRLIQKPENRQELQVMVDALTTNETYFFREPAHFDLLRAQILPTTTSNPVRIWSAACSSGEEVYSIAMTLSETLRTRSWEVLGSDISTRMLKLAQAGHYPLLRNEGISFDYLKKYCLKGTGPQNGTCLVMNQLKQRVSFKQINLIKPLPDIGTFDVVFLRNVLIYFDQQTKLEIIRRISKTIRPGGYLLVSHTESLHSLNHDLHLIKPSIFRK